MSRVIDVDEYTLDAEVLQSTRPVLVDFCHFDSAASATMLAVLEGLAAEVQGRIKIARVDVSGSPTLAAQYEIASPPAILVFHSGIVIHRTADLLAETRVAAESSQARGVVSRVLGLLGRTDSEPSRRLGGLGAAVLTKIVAMGLIGLGGSIVGMICGWEVGPLSLELGRGNLTWLGAAGGGLATIAATRHASERSEARARSQKQMEILRTLLGSL